MRFSVDRYTTFDINSLIFWFLLLCFCQLCLAREYVVPYDNVPISRKTWEEIDITWPNQYDNDKPNTARLLRPVRFIKAHHLAVGQLARLNMVGIGIPNQGTIVTAIKALPHPLAQPRHTGIQPVIGYFKHYVNDVRVYRFKDRYGHISTIHATPNHPFYVKELQSFLPISQVKQTMALIGIAHHAVHLVCKTANATHCGIPYHPGHLFVVYNIEVYRQHIYRVGHLHILVHNKSLKEIRRLPIIGKGTSRTVYYDKSNRRIYKVYLPERSRGRKTLGLHDLANAEYGDLRLNAVFDVIFDGKYKRYSTFRIYNDSGTHITEGPYIEGTPLKGEFSGGNDMIPQSTIDEVSRHGFSIDDNKPENFMLTAEGDVIPTDGKWLGRKDELVFSRRSERVRERPEGRYSTRFYKVDDVNQ